MSAATLSSRWLGRAGTIGFVVAALALGRVIGNQFPDPIQEFEQPHLVHAEVGEVAELRLAQVQVDAVHVGTQFRTDGALMPTDGVWVMADITMTPTLQDAGLPYLRMVDAQGRTFGLTRGSTTNTCRVSQPGIPLVCSVAIELPADAVPGIVLEAAPVLDPRYDNVASVDLGLQATDAEQALAADEPVVPLDDLGGGRDVTGGTDR